MDSKITNKFFKPYQKNHKLLLLILNNNNNNKNLKI